MYGNLNNMYRTDKQFMTNPATAPSRVYIGGLAKTIVAADLEEKFKIHGRILGLVLQMGFAFIQFENEGQAQAAIKNENNTMLHGRKICVRQALDKSQKGANNPNNQNRRQGLGINQGPPQQLQIQNQGQGQAQGPNQNQGPPVPPPPQVNNNPPSTHNESQPPPKQFSQLTEELQKPESEKEPSVEHPPPQGPPNIAPKNSQPVVDDIPKNDGPPEKRSRKRRMRSRDRFQQPVDMYRDDSYYSRDDYVPPSANYSNRPPVLDQPDRNDCEIIVVSKLLT